MTERIKCGINTTHANWEWVYPPAVRRRFAEHLAFDDTSLPAAPDRDAVVGGSRGARVVLATWGAVPFDAELLDACPDLGLILYAAGSVKGIVTDELAERGIPLVSAAAANAVPVAEFVLGIILTSLKNVFFHRGELSQRGPEAWHIDKSDYQGGYYHTKVGVIGDGLVVRHLLSLLSSFSMEVLVASEYLTEEDEKRYGARRATLEELMESCDVVTVHHADIPRYWNIINKRTLSLLKPGARLINTSRGRLVNEADLIEKLEEGRIYAYLDVTHPEPPPAGHPFYTLPNCVLTPHVAGSVGREVERMSYLCLDELGRWLKGEPLQAVIDYSLLSGRA